MSDIYNVVAKKCLRSLLRKLLQVPGAYFVLLVEHMLLLYFDIPYVMKLFLLCYRMDRYTYFAYKYVCIQLCIHVFLVESKQVMLLG